MHYESVSYLFLFNFGLCVVVYWLLSIRQVLSSIFDVCPFKDYTGAAC